MSNFICQLCDNVMTSPHNFYLCICNRCGEYSVTFESKKIKYITLYVENFYLDYNPDINEIKLYNDNNELLTILKENNFNSDVIKKWKERLIKMKLFQ